MEEQNDPYGAPHFCTPTNIINTIKFSAREVDVLACIIGGRSTKRIASFLSLSPRTVENYIRNIMLKLECNSRDGILDFIEQSDQQLILKDHYSNLLTQAEFEKSLREIGRLNHQGQTCILVWEEGQSSTKPFIHLVEKHFKFVGLAVAIKTQKAIEPFLQHFNPPETIDYLVCIGSPSLWAKLQREQQEINSFLDKSPLFLKKILVLSLEKEMCLDKANSPHIEVIKAHNYYLVILGALQKILPHINIDKIILDFEKKITTPLLLHNSVSPHQHEQNDKKTIVSLFNTYRWRVIAATFVLGLISIGFVNISFQREKGFEGNNPSQNPTFFMEDASKNTVADKNDSVTQYNLGVLYDRGYGGVEKNPQKALEWYEKAASQYYPPALYEIGIHYDKGEGIKKDPKKAFESYEKAALLGHTKAQFQVGYIYHWRSEVIPQDYKRAAFWYEQAIKQNDPNAQYYLATLYAWGQGVTKNFKKAKEFYHIAADQNHTYAQFSLGEIYDLGLGVPPNYEKATNWYLKAATQGHSVALKNFLHLLTKQELKKERIQANEPQL